MEELLNIDNTAVRTHSHLFLIEGKSWLVDFFCPACSVFTLYFSQQVGEQNNLTQLMPFPPCLIWEVRGASECETRRDNWHSPSSIRKSNGISSLLLLIIHSEPVTFWSENMFIEILCNSIHLNELQVLYLAAWVQESWRLSQSWSLSSLLPCPSSYTALGCIKVTELWRKYRAGRKNTALKI